MKLQNLTIIFIIIILPIILLVSLYINTGLKTIRYQSLYDTGLLTATQDAIQAFETNTQNNKYADNPEEKRSIIKSSIKMFETSLCNTCNISSYNTDEIEDYIPAMLFGMYDGFYLYAPSLNPDTDRYEHSLKNYVYYSEIVDEENAIVIRYSLDSYVKVSGYFPYTDPDTGETKKRYESREGFLLNEAAVGYDEMYGFQGTYYGLPVDLKDEWAVNYFEDNRDFSHWFTNIAKLGDIKDYLDINADNDPEDPNSAFVQHKNKIIREKIENVLNSSITAYSERTWGQNYKMPELTEEEWERIYSDISLTTFFQGKRIGLTKYNGYCVLNSNNHYEFINPNLLYFSTDNGGESTGINNPDGEINSSYDYYHDIRCSMLEDYDSASIAYGSIGNVKTELGEIEGARKEITTLRGWKIGRFRKVKIEKDESGNPINTGTTSTSKTGPQLKYQDYNTYMYERAECGCYLCINGSLNTNISVYEYISVAKELEGTTDNEYLKSSYWTSLARERARLHVEEPEPDFEVTKTAEAPKKVINGGEITYTLTITNRAPMAENINIRDGVTSENDIITSHRITSWEIRNSDGNEVGYYATEGSDQMKIFDVYEGCNVWLAEGQTLTIKYTAKVKDINGDNLVENTIAGIVTRGGNNYIESDTEICETVNSDLEVIKTLESAGVEIANSKENPVSDQVLEHGSTVKYTVKIKNRASLTDKIRIEDWFDSTKITDVNASSIKINGNSPQDEYEGDERHLIWPETDIASGDTITIEFEAKLKGELGSYIINRVKVESLYTGYTVDGENSVQCKIERTIKFKGEGGENYHVILVLDSSTSMMGKIGNARDAANELVSELGEDKVTIISFAQSASVINSLSQYQIITKGISTNYVAGLSVAQNSIKPNVNNYIVFMSDGGPTNTQGVDRDWSDENILKQLWDGFWDGIEGFGAAIYGGWIELDWIGEDEYKFRLLLTNMIEDVIEIFGNDIVNFAFGDLAGLSKSVWKNIIMPEVNLLKSISKQIYTIYYDTGGGNDPIYGLDQIATSDQTKDRGYHTDDAQTLKEIFQEISQEIKQFQVDDDITTENGIIKIMLYEHITAIEVGENKISPSDLEKVKSKIVPTGDGSGTLNLNDSEILNILKIDEDIKIIY